MHMKMSLLMEQYGILLDRHRQPFPSFLLCLFLLSCFQSIRGVPFQSADGLPFHITNNKRLSPPIVYTVAGSDSGGGAGIQADLHAIHNMYCHGCSAITCLTAQNSVGVTGIHAPPLEFLQQQLDTLWDDLPPRAIKIGMLGTKELAIRVGKMLKQWKESSPVGTRLFHVVLDPVMISTSGSKLIEDDAVEAMIQHVFPHADVLTPNKFEAQALLNRTLETPKDVEQAARDLLQLGVKSVLIKGGHTLTESIANGSGSRISAIDDSLGYAQDYFLSSAPPRKEGEQRLCDGCRGVWIRSQRYDSEHTHGTGCTLSSAIASALALGQQQRDENADRCGAMSAMDALDACCLGKAYVTAGIACGVGLGKGPGPVAHTSFPSTHEHFPVIALDPSKHDPPPFQPMKSFSSPEPECQSQLGKVLPIVDTVEWVERLCHTPGVTDIQLRFKDLPAGKENSPTTRHLVLDRVKQCQKICQSSGVRLWINDFWQAAVEAGCFGVHLGQEDLVKCIEAGGLQRIRDANMALGISTHTFGELAAALGVRPSYISLGPIFKTSSKSVGFDPQGLWMVTKWRQLIPPNVPLVTIGGISDASTAKQVREAGADCVAVIGAATQAANLHVAVSALNNAMEIHS